MRYNFTQRIHLPCEPALQKLKDTKELKTSVLEQIMLNNYDIKFQNELTSV